MESCQASQTAVRAAAGVSAEENRSEHGKKQGEGVKKTGVSAWKNGAFAEEREKTRKKNGKNEKRENAQFRV